jgi:hypothetical protein
VSAKQKGIGFGWCLGGWNELLGALVVADLLYPPPAPRLPLVPSSNAIEAGRRRQRVLLEQAGVVEVTRYRCDAVAPKSQFLSAPEEKKW